MKYLRNFLLLFAIAMTAATSVRAQLTITPTFDSTINSLSNAAAVKAAINAAIAQTQASITTVHLTNVSIDFVIDNSTGLGSNISATNNLSYSQYLADLQSNPNKSALQTAALATMPTGPIGVLNNNTTVTLTAANLAAIGETSLANAAVFGNGGFNGTVYLNLSIMNVSRTSGQLSGNYDLQTVAQHEIDEVLGIGGYASTLIAPGAPLPTTLGSLDFFRYSAPGVRSFTTNKNAVSYFSVDGGQTVITHFLNTGDGDYADWSAGVAGSDNPNSPPQVQDAFATPFGQAPPANLATSELTAFQVVGYNLVSQAGFWSGKVNNLWNINGNWATDAQGTPANAIPTSTADVTFSAAGAANQGNTLLGQNFTIHNLTIADALPVTISSGSGGPYTLTISGNSGNGINVQVGSGLLTLNANLAFSGSSNTVTVNNIAGTVINGVISGANGLVKAGTGTLTLGAANTYTGTTNVARGLVITSVAGALPATTNLVLGTATSSLTGSVDLSGKNQTVNSLTLATGNSGGAGNVITSNNGSATLTVSSTTTSSTFGGLISGPVSLVKAGAGTTLALAAANTYTGSTTVTGGTLQIGITTTAGSIASTSGVSITSGGTLSLVNVTGNTFAANVTNGVSGVGTLNFNSSNTITVSGALTDGGAGQLALSQTGSGTTILTGNSSYTGATTVSAGVLQIGDGVSGNLAGNSVVTVSGSGTLSLNLLDSANLIKSISLNANGAVLKTIQSGTNTLSGVISGTGSFNQNGTGTTILTNAETYTGATNVTTGTLQVDGSLAGGSLVHVLTGGTLSGQGTINGNATLAGNGVINFASGGDIVGTLGITGGNWNGVGTVNGAVTSSSNIFNLNGSLTALSGLSVNGGTLAGTGTLTGSLNYTSGSSSTFGGTIAGNGATLTVNKGGTLLVLTGNSTYTGATLVSGGTLQIGDGVTGDLIGTSSITVSGNGILALNYSDNSTFTRNVSLSATGATLKAIQSGTNTFSGVISGTGLFVQNGTGTTILTNAETYTGATSVTTGTLQVDGSLAGGTVGIATAGTLSGQGTINGNATLTGNGAINFASGGHIVGTLGITGGNWNGVGTVNGLVTSSSGVFNLNGDLTALSGLTVSGGTFAGNGNLTGNLNYTSSSSSSFGGTIAGTGATVTMNNSSATLTLFGNNTYTGATTVTAGTLQVGNGAAGNLFGTSGVTVAGTASLAINLADNATFTQNITLSAIGASVKAIEAGTNTLSGLISGTGGFNQNGTGTTILTNNETYTGATNVNGGTLEVDGSLATTSIMHVLTAGTLKGTGTIKGTATLTGNGTINFGSGGNILGTLTATGGNWSGLGTVGGLVTSSTGNFNLTGSLTAPAGLAVTGGTLAGTGTLIGNLNHTSSVSSTFGGVITGTGATLTKNNSTSTLTLAGNNTYTGLTTITAGTLQVGNGATGNLSNTSGVTVAGTGILAINLADGSTFTPNITLSATGSSVKAIEAGTNTLSGLISGLGLFNQSGTGTTILTNNETYTGVTNVNTGTLEVDGSLSATSAVHVLTGGTLAGTGTVKGLATLTGNGTINFGAGGNILGTLGVTGGNWSGLGTVGGLITSSTGAFNLTGNLTATNGLSVTGGTLTGNGTLNGKLTYTSIASSTFGGVIAGPGTVTMNHSGTTLTLTGANTYSGATTITAGTVQIGNGVTGSVANTSGVTVAGSGILALNLANSAIFTQHITLVASSGSVKMIQSGTNTIAGLISGAGIFNQSGTGTTILNNTETYTGATNVNTGTLEVDGSLASTAVHVLTGGTLTGTGTLKGLATLAGNGTINFGAGGNIFGTLAITGGNWSGLGTVGGLVTSSTGTFNLTGNLTANNGLSVTAGTLTGNGILNGKLTYTSSLSSTFGGVIAGNGPVTLNRSGITLTLTGSNTYTGATNVTAGTLQLGNGIAVGASLGLGNVTIGRSGTLALNLANGETFANQVANSGHLTSNSTAGSYTISSTVSGTGNFIKNGAGTVALTKANAYSGGTLVNAGTLLVNNLTGSGTGSGAVAVNAGATLGGSGTITGALSLNSGGTIAPGAGTPGVAGTTLHATSMMWNAGGTLSLQLGPVGDELVLTGALTKGGTGSYTVNLTDAGITQSSYTLATFASTTLSLANFTLIAPAGYTGTLVETATSLSVDLVFHGQLPHQSSILPVDDSTSIAQSTGTIDPTTSDTTPTLDSYTPTTSPTPDSSALDSTPMIESSPLIASPTDDSSSFSSGPLFVTPEPGSAALLAFGVTALLGRRQRRRR